MDVYTTVKKLSAWARVKFTLMLLCGLVCSTSAQADFIFNMTPGVTAFSRDIYHLHMTIFWICVAVGVAVFSVMFYAIIWHRKSRGVEAAHFHESTTVEIIWTLVPFFILVIMAIPATQLLLKMSAIASDSDLSIKITGHQWYWEYEYLGQDLKFFSNITTAQDQIHDRDVKPEHYLRDVDNPLVLPVGKKIRFLATANDVIHAWWVPALGIKKDAIPGFINEAWAVIDTPGIYRGQCAELCGVLHGFMPIVVDAKSEEDFNAWLTAKKQEAQTPK